MDRDPEQKPDHARIALIGTFILVFLYLMKYSSIPSAQTVALHFKSRGIQNIVISPGSRNAPLTIGFTEDEFFNCYSIVDERCAAFFALGMALQLQQPVAVVCTSGSALLNYYPAVAEAFYSDIPLIVVSADRPPYKIDVGDGQTIRQEHVFKKHIGYEANLKLDVSHATKTVAHFAPDYVKSSQEEIQKYNDGELHKALSLAIGSKSPVHINVPFEEPLYEKVGALSIPQVSAKQTFEGDSESEDVASFAELWNKSERKMVLVGMMFPNSIDQELLEKLANDPSVLVFTETTSNLHHPDFFPSIDSIIFPIEKSINPDALFKALQPNLLLTFGGMVVSKKIKAFLRKYKPAQHWHIDAVKAYDTYFSEVKHIKLAPNIFLKQLLGKHGVQESAYDQKWQKVKSLYQAKRTEYLDQVPFSDFWAYSACIEHIPQNYQVHFANSSAIRYAQLFDMHESLGVFCNRGTSGIDGSTSTAIGAAVHEERPTLLITGDLSFFYDSNALWNDYIRQDFKIILVNNGGGGIFRILPGKENSENFNRFFETQHQLDAKALSAMFGFEYKKAASKSELKSRLQEFFKESERPRILEIFTPTDINDEILLAYFDFIS
ncbi:2-succinyl-5-enolpyruvyl-6-hydroxy-3-cyclohexene-1-carboxylic-acid synthase [Allomuricauda sp. d1]|uniref:2-succinyl-5-enolpyruvyl-6-hydroxy-3- cyclohexene-1-carboxylic-acid synthase n=1 Tax=Allomuricauda sp. d1 TaxID=3136725 RepID=UPI0031DF63B0